MNVSDSKKHQIRRVVEAVYSTPWAITEAKLSEILDVVERRQAGRLSAEELAALGFADDGEPDEKPYHVTPAGVAVMSLSGVLSQRMNLLARFSGGTSTEQFGRAFDAAIKDPAVKAIVLDINSSGGAVSGTPELADKVFAARGQKPIVAVADTQMASGAYWIGSAADEIVASPSANVGSIGVLFVHAERSKMDHQAGLARTIIKAGKWKALGNDIEPLSADGREKLQSWVDSAYDLFVEAVARHRNVSAATVRAGYGEGDTLMARDAKAAGLVDRIATLDEVLAQIESRLGGSAAPQPPASSPSKKPIHSHRGTTIMDPKLKAALFARGLISADASDELAQAALAAFYAGRGATVPADPSAVIADVFGQRAETKPDAGQASDGKKPDAAAAGPDLDARLDEALARREKREEDNRKRPTFIKTAFS
jgi:signal peptide peptidase SppA